MTWYSVLIHTLSPGAIPIILRQLEEIGFDRKNLFALQQRPTSSISD